MNEQEPKYFSEFKKELYGKLDEHTKRFDKLDETLDSHQEFIADLAVDVTKVKEGLENVQKDVGVIKGDIVLMKEGIKGLDRKLDSKADASALDTIGRRTKKLEKVVFA